MEWQTEDGERVFVLWAEILVSAGESVKQVAARIQDVVAREHQEVFNGFFFSSREDDSGNELAVGTIIEVCLGTDEAAGSVRETLAGTVSSLPGVARVEL